MWRFAAVLCASRQLSVPLGLAAPLNHETSDDQAIHIPRQVWRTIQFRTFHDRALYFDKWIYRVLVQLLAGRRTQRFQMMPMSKPTVYPIHAVTTTRLSAAPKLKAMIL